MSQEKTLVTKNPLLMQRFTVLKTLGEGAVGAVYLVQDRQNESKEVALKVMTNQIDLDDNTRERFRQEINLLFEIDHMHVAKAYDVIENDDYLAYTMEFIDGADLGSIYKDHEFSVSTVEKIVMQTLSALGALHAKGVWHRDIKLENILITKEGQVKLIDLGLVKNEFQKDFTKTGILLGTAQYMPPEYIKEGTFDSRGDIYAMGVVLFELLIKRRRLPNMPGNKIIENLIATNFQIPDRELLPLQEKHRRIIKKAMYTKLKKRFQNAREMMDAFKEEVPETNAIKEINVASTVSFGDLGKIKQAEKNDKIVIAVLVVVLLLTAILVGIYLMA